MNKILTYIVCLLCMFTVQNLFAQTANLSIQGVLRNANGTAVENGQYSLTFKLYTEPTTGTKIWEETIDEVDVEGGIYSVVLGAADTPLDAAFDQPYFLGVIVEGGTELIPRARLTSSPYALSLIGSDNIFPNSGNVGVGADHPQHKLTVQRGNGILGLEAEEEANKTATITTTSEGIQFNAEGTNNIYGFNNGKLQVNQQLINGDTVNAALGFDNTESDNFVISNSMGKIILTPTNNPVEIKKEGEALKLVGSDSTFMSFATQGGTNLQARLGFFNNDTLMLETAGQDFIIDAKGGTTRIMNTLEVGKNETNYYTQTPVSFMSVSSHDGNKIYSRGNNHIDRSAIWAHDDIAAVLFKAFSDKRIKKDFRLSNAQDDLKTLKQVEVTDYRHIDEIKNGPDFRKGFIAQQLKTVFPEAVSLSPQYIPSIYALSSSIKRVGNNIVINLDQAHNLKANDKVKIMLEDGEREVVVINVEDEFTFAISPSNLVIKDEVFVYGKEVDDFHSVDYDRVFTLAVSATQELARKIEALEKENQSLKSTIKENEVSQLKLNANVDLFIDRVRKIESLFEATGQK